jgi:hypothetical protein
MSTFRRNVKILLAVCVLVALTAVAAIAQEGGDPLPPGQEAPQVTTIEEQALEAASVLRTARDTGDRLPEELAGKIDERADFGMNPDLSRRAVGGTTPVYLIPADDHVCAAMTVGDGATVTCATTSDLAGGRVAPATVGLANGAIGIYGIAPDGVDSVSIAAGESSTRAEVVDNGYLAVIPAGSALESASYTGPSGPVEFPIYDPWTVGEE